MCSDDFTLKGAELKEVQVVVRWIVIHTAGLAGAANEPMRSLDLMASSALLGSKWSPFLT